MRGCYIGIGCLYGRMYVYIGIFCFFKNDKIGKIILNGGNI